MPDSSPTPVIHSIAEADMSAIQQLIYRTIDYSYSPVYPPQVLAFFRDFHSMDRISDRCRRGVVLKGVMDGGLAATGAFLDGEILGVFVSPDYQRHGLGRSIMLELEKAAGARGYAQVSLSVSLPSRQFYEGLGYRIVETCSHPVADGACLDYWKAQKIF